MSGDGGKPENIVKVDAGQSASAPQLLPRGRAILFTLARKELDVGQIVVQSLDTGDPPRRPGERHRRAIPTNGPSRVCAREHTAGGAL